MKDFKSYSSQNGKPGAQNGASGGSGDNLNATVDLANTIARAMNGKNERQILSAILSEAERGKRAGTLSNDDIDRFYTALSPMLDGAKRRKLKEIIERLKQI